MMSSQLGRMILDGSASSQDEMSAVPDGNGAYGGEGLLDDIAAAIAGGVDSERRPGSSSSAD